MIDFIKRLTEVNAPSGWENAARDLVMELANPYVDSMEVDALGNLFAQKKSETGNGVPVVLSAYLDEPGLMIKKVDEDGFLKFGLMAGTDRRTILGRRCAVGDTFLPGVIGMKPIHLTPKKEREETPKGDELYLDLGMKADDVKKTVFPGDMGVFYGPMEILGTDKFYGKAMGRSVTCSILLELMRCTFPVDVVFVFTTQRLVGNRGAYGASARLRPERTIVLDLCAGAESGEETPILGKGAVIPAMDDGAIYHDFVCKSIRGAGKSHEIPMQFAGRIGGKTDGAVYQSRCGGGKAAAVLIPALYPSGACQMVNRQDIKAAKELLYHTLCEMEG